MWINLVTQKYIYVECTLDWIRNPENKSFMCSIIWKATLSVFAVVGDGLTWCIGNGYKVHLGAYPWKGSEGHHLLLPDLIQVLHEKGYCHLNHVVDHD
jgi:hypothetical protein